MATTIEVNKQSVKQLLETGKDHLFVIPEYQRPYAWTEEQIVTLFEDLWEFTSNLDENDTKATYFLGTVVSYENENNEQEIIDGQQRITSLFLLLRAIYTKLQSIQIKDNKVNNFITQIQPAIWKLDKYTGEVDYNQILIKSEVVNNEGNEILRDILRTGQVSKDAKDNYSKNYMKLMELYEKASIDNPLKIYDFIYVILNQAILLPITADTQDTALTIFSTLNDRGLPLSDADIFKAKIYNRLDKDGKNQFIDVWKELDENAEYCKESIQQLFYYYMFCLRAKEKDNKTTTPGVRKYFSADKFIRLYEPNILHNLSVILNVWKVVNKNEIIENEPWSSNYEILQVLDILNSYPNEFWKYPVVIYYFAHREEKDFEDNFLRFLRKLCSELITKYIEIPTINAVKASILNLNVEIIESPQPIFNFKQTDKNIVAAGIKNPHRNIVRMLLKILSYNRQKELLPEKWEIEHMFPQKWKDNYFTDVDDKIIKEKIEHIGNKIPLQKKLNIVAGNGYFNKKKVEYKKSDIAIVQEMVQFPNADWTLDDIAERDVRLSDELTKLLDDWNYGYTAIKSKDEPSDHNFTEEQLELLKQLKESGQLDQLLKKNGD